MSDRADEIIQALFARAGADSVAAPLASSFAQAFTETRWTTEALDKRVRSIVERTALRADPSELQAVE